MPLPVKLKTWQIAKNIAALSMPQALFGLHDALVSFGTNPVAVAGSSDGVTGAMDAVDRWASDSSVIRAAPGSPHSWMVHTRANGSQFCIDYSTTGAGDITVVLSPGGLFTGGDESNRPTATDEAAMVNRAEVWKSGNTRVNVWHSTDGMMSYVIIPATGATSRRSLWVMGQLSSPYPDLPGAGNVLCVWGSSGAIVGDLCTQDSGGLSPEGTFLVVPPSEGGDPGSPGWMLTQFANYSGHGPIAYTPYAINEMTGAYLMSRTGVSRFDRDPGGSGSPDPNPWHGPFGILPDLYATSQAPGNPDGKHAPLNDTTDTDDNPIVGGARAWVKIDQLFLPWDGGTAMEIT
jgi:hypothetical protein